MKCMPIPGGFVCGGRRTVKACSTPQCGAAAAFECDFPVKRRKPGASQTCDARMCAKCRRNQGTEKDFCPPHDELCKAVGVLHWRHEGLPNALCGFALKTGGDNRAATHLEFVTCVACKVLAGVTR